MHSAGSNSQHLRGDYRACAHGAVVLKLSVGVPRCSIEGPGVISFVEVEARGLGPGSSHFNQSSSSFIFFLNRVWSVQDLC